MRGAGVRAGREHERGAKPRAAMRPGRRARASSEGASGAAFDACLVVSVRISTLAGILASTL